MSPDPPAAPRPGRRGHGRRPLPAHLPRERVEHNLAEAEKACPCCGRARTRIGAEVSEQLDYRPASLLVVEHLRHTYACATCSRTHDPADGTRPAIATATWPQSPIGKGLPGPGLLAHVVASKVAAHLPLNRLEGILGRHAVALNRSTLGGWVRACAELLGPLVGRMAAGPRVGGDPDGRHPGPAAAPARQDPNGPPVGLPRRRGEPVRRLRLHHHARGRGAGEGG